jgi:uncharacterized RDD family membrane protein YckC
MNRNLDNHLISPTRKRRFACMLYEALLLFGVIFIADYLFDTLTQSRHGLMLRHERQAWLFCVLGFYFIWFWCHGGQTLAMKTWHLKIVSEKGSRINYVQALIRYILSFVFIPTGIAFIYSLFDKNGQFPQDRIVKTLMVSSAPNSRGVESVLSTSVD